MCERGEWVSDSGLCPVPWLTLTLIIINKRSSTSSCVGRLSSSFVVSSVFVWQQLVQVFCIWWNATQLIPHRDATQRNQEPHWRRRSLQQSMRLLPSARINTAGSVTADVTSRHVRSAASWIPDYFRQNQVYSSLIFFLSEVSLRFVNSAAVTSSIETRSCFSFITNLPKRLQFCYIVIYFLSSVFQSRFCLLFCRLRLPAD